MRKIGVIRLGTDLVVMGYDSCSGGCDFESHNRIIDGYYSNIFVVKLLRCFEQIKNKLKTDWVGS